MSMIIMQFASELVREIDEKLATQENAVTRGIANHDEYMRCVGLIQGLRAMKDYIKDLANRAEREDDD